MASARSPVWPMRASSSASSGVVKRTWLAVVWRWMNCADQRGESSASACLALASTK